MSDYQVKRGRGRPRKPLPPPVSKTVPEPGALIEHFTVMTQEIKRRLDYALELNPHDVPGRDWVEAYQAASLNSVKLDKARVELAVALKKQHGAMTQDELDAAVSQAMTEYISGMADDEWSRLNEMRKEQRENDDNEEGLQ